MATITRWDPVTELLSLRNFFEDARSPLVRTNIIPALDLSETDNSFLVEMAVPGLKAEDLTVTVENNVLTIKGEMHKTSEENRTYHRVERRYGSFQRSITLPSRVKSDEIEATLSDGVLRLEIPKAEESKPRRIAINVMPAQPIEISNN